VCVRGKWKLEQCDRLAGACLLTHAGRPYAGNRGRSPERRLPEPLLFFRNPISLADLRRRNEK
jgi:hypothetical protein